MALLSLEEFTVAVGDIHGTTPDGGGNASTGLARGTWRRLTTNLIAAANGLAFALSHVSTTTKTFYILDPPVGGWPADQRVSINLPQTIASDVYIGVRFDPAGAGYVLRIRFNSTTAQLMRRAANGVETSIWTQAVTATAMNQWDLEVKGTTLRVFQNGAQIHADTTDSTYASGSPAIGLVPIAAQTVAVPATTVEMDSLWDDSGDLGSVDWFKTTIAGTPAIYAKILGPQGVASANSALTRTVTGFTAGREYWTFTDRVRRMCGQPGESPTAFPVERLASLLVADGAGGVTLVHQYAWSRAGQLWSVVIDNFSIIGPSVTGSHTLNAQGLGTVEAHITAHNVNYREVLAYCHHVGFPSGAGINLAILEWWSRVGTAPAFETLPFDHNQAPGTWFDTTAIGGPGAFQQGFFGNVLNPPVSTDDVDFTHTVHDRIIGGDTWFRATRIYGPPAGIEWFKVQDACVSPPPPVPCPPPPPPPVVAFEYPYQVGIPHEVPIPDGISTADQPASVGVRRSPPVKKYVVAMGAYRELVPGLDPDDHGDPGECEPIPGCDPPIADPGTLDPLEDRLFFCWDLAATLINVTPFTASVQGFPSVFGQLGQAQARNGAIIGSQGGYAKFIVGGAYSPSAMDSFIESLAPQAGLLQAAQAAEYFYGVSAFDDFDSHTLWPPSGIGNAEINRVAAKWKSVIPGIRVTIRGRPTQLVGGGSVANLDGCIAQFRQGLGTPAAFMSAELSAAGSIGISGILWSMNFVNGGDGSSGIPGSRPGLFEMSAAEVQAACFQFASSATLNHGIGGWKYYSALLNRPGMMAALTNGRNALAALP